MYVLVSEERFVLRFDIQNGRSDHGRRIRAPESKNRVCHAEALGGKIMEKLRT